MNPETSIVTPVVGTAAATYTYLGLPLSTWVSIVTITFIVLQIVVILPKVLEAVRKLFRKGTDVEGIDDSP